MCMIDDGERSDVWRAQIRPARRQHNCGECRRRIEKGERYEYATSLYDGSWSGFKSCLNCVAARSWLVETCRGYVTECIREELESHWNEGREHRSIWLARAIVGMRRKWRTRKGRLMTPLPKWAARDSA